MTETNQNKDNVPDFHGGADKPAEDSNGRSSYHDQRKKRIRWAVGAVVLILALAFGLPAYLHSLSHESTDDAFIDGNVIPVSSRIPGHVIRVHVRDNQWVHAGDILVELDPNDYETRRDAARAILEGAKAADRGRNIAVELMTISSTSELDQSTDKVAAAKAAVQEASERLILAGVSLEQSRAEAGSAEAVHQRDDMDLKRSEQLADAQTVSQQVLDHARATEQISASALTAAQKKIDIQKAMVRGAEAALKAAKANLRQVESRLVAAQAAPTQVKQSRSQADMSNADIDRANAELTQAGLNLSYTKIYAPCDGFVTQKSVEAGQFVQVGQSLLALVPRALWITANFKETQLTHMRPGQPVEISLDAYPDLILHGHVDSIQHGTGSRFSLLPPQNATGNYVKVVQRVPVKIVFDETKPNDQVLMVQGMQVVPDVNVGAPGWPDGGKGHPEDKQGEHVAP